MRASDARNFPALLFAKIVSFVLGGGNDIFFPASRAERVTWGQTSRTREFQAVSAERVHGSDRCFEG